jgi:hypothetical protein
VELRPRYPSDDLIPAVSKLDMFASLSVASKIGSDLLDKSSGSPAGNMLPISSCRGKGAGRE